MPPGRAIRATDAAEVQVAFVGAAPSRAEVRRVVAALRAREPSPVPDEGSAFAPIRLRPLPSRVALSQLPIKAGRFTVGVAGDRAEPLSIDLFAGAARLLVVGPPRSGRSSVLHALLVQALRDDVPVMLAARQRTLLARTAEAYGIAVLGPDAPAAGASASGQTRTLLLVDDSEAFLDTPVGDALTAAVRNAPAGLSAVVAANSDDVPVTYRGVAAEVRRSRCALVLQPGSSDADLVGRRLRSRRGAQLPGRGLLVADPAWGDSLATEPVPLQVALP
jgi:S-DNA-T family DNA segregation ATPase FtsK/SpoIIIE